jgi:DEAD/DEAH box helicase
MSSGTSESTGSSCSESLSRVEELERQFLRRRASVDDSLALVHFPECNTPRPDDGGLYPYQRVARDLLRSGRSLNLLVASPTGSGKTRVIEEAIAVAREQGQRIFVAEPLIALVEQIYSRLKGEDVCMLTGPSKRGAEAADVTICTFEVLASKAAAQPECLDGCPRLVIDEFHYLASERGTVLQEILSHCRAGRGVVALSGTMPNVAELAALLSRINGFPTYVLGAARRPIDISFHCYSVESARSTPLRPARQAPPLRAQAVGGLADRQALLHFLRLLAQWDCNPSLLVSFSCRKLDEMANWAASVSCLERSERALVERGFARLLRGVPEEDRCIFSVYQQWARCGVAVHHSHAPTPYLELVSWLAERRVLRFIFSSSTLSAGINLPVRTMCLLSARIPQKQADGSVAHADLDPMLFHQLVGRAGRPGLETCGHCVIVVRREEDYPSAQALLMSRVPAVLPRGAFELGDVLRATRGRRDLAAELRAVAEPHRHGLSLSLGLSERLRAQAFEALGVGREQQEALILQARELVGLQKAPRALLPLCLVRAPRPSVLHVRRDGGFFVSSDAAQPPEEEQVIPLTASQKAKLKVPLEELERVVAVRAAFERVLQAEQRLEGLAGERRLLLARLCLNHEEAEALLADSPLRAELRAALGDLERRGFVRSDAYGAAVTQLGAAACEVRTLLDPTPLLEALLRSESLGALQSLALASQALQDGGGGRAEEAAAVVAALLEEGDAFAGLLRRAQEVLQDVRARWPPAAEAAGGDPLATLAALAWGQGASLEQLRALLPVGSFCRHVTRAHDLCTELVQALGVLGVDGAAFQAAADLLCRGLPFLRRGYWKRAAEDEEED